MLGAIFGTLLMGCSDEEIANMETSSRNAIGFNVLSNAAETRATPTTPDNLTSTDFDVFAFTADGTAFMGKVDTEFGHDGVKIVYKMVSGIMTIRTNFVIGLTRLWTFTRSIPQRLKATWTLIICGKSPRMNKRYIIPASMSMEAPMVMKTTT